MKRIIVLLLLLCGNISLNAQININPDPNGDPWIVGGIPIISAEIQSELGIHSYLSNVLIQNNNIFNNDYGIAGFHSSDLAILGDSTAHDYASTQQLYNNRISQCIFSLSSFPYEFHWNAVGDYNDMDKPYIKAVNYEEIGHDTSGTHSRSGVPHYDVTYNCWSQDNDTNPTNRLLPVGDYAWRPIWCPGKDHGHNLDSPGTAYYNALYEIENGNFEVAETDFKTIINEYPDSKYSLASLKALYALNPLLYDTTFLSLKSYYDSLCANPSDSLLGKTAQWLSIHCNIKDELYQQAVDSLVLIITNPLSYEDSIYALIDLGYVFTKMEDTSNLKSSLVTAHDNLIPKTYKQYVVKRNDWIEELLKDRQEIVKSSLEQSNSYLEAKPVEIIAIYPNPTLDKTTITFKLVKEGMINISIYSLAGQELINLRNRNCLPGIFHESFSLNELPKSIYYVLLYFEDVIVDSEKLIIIR